MTMQYDLDEIREELREVARRVVKDVCNPAIHTWEVSYA